MARRRKKRKNNLHLLGNKTIANKKKRKAKERRESSLLTKEEIEKLHELLLSLDDDLLAGKGHSSIYVTEDNKILGLGKRGRMSQEEIDELLKYMLKE